MNINKNNYEAWFLDYYEGTLTAEQVAELFLFLKKNLELKNEFESFALIRLPDSQETFAKKNELKKNIITLENYNEYLIAELEGDLKLQERVALKAFMDAHPELEKDRTLLRKTILQKDVAVIYPAKEQLKKRLLVSRSYNTWWIAAAAIILLLIGVYFIQSPEKVQVAQQQNENSSQDAVNNHAAEKTIKNFASTSDTPTNKLQATASLPETSGGQEGEAKTNNPSTENKIKEETISNKNLASIPVKSSGNSLHNKKVKEVKPEEKSQDNNTELAMLPAPRIESELLISNPEETPGKIVELHINAPTVEQKHLNNPLQRNDETAEHFPLKSKIVKAVAWFVSKASNNNVKLNTDFDVNGNLAAYQLSAGKFRVEKNF